MGLRGMRFVAHRHGAIFREMKIITKVCLTIWMQYIFVDYKNNIRTYLRYFGSGKSNGSVWLSIEGTTVPVRAMLSVRDTAIAAQKVSPEFEECSCSVPLVLSNTVLFLYDQVTDIRPSESSGVVTTLDWILPENTNISNRNHLAAVERVQESLLV